MGSIAARVVIAIALTVAFYLLAVALMALLGFVLYEEFTEAAVVSGRVIIPCIVGIAAIFWSVLPRIDRFPDPGERLLRAQQPRLWRVIEEVANATAQPMPAEVFLISDVNAFVAQRGGLVGIGSRRVLGIGLPLLQVLTTGQLRAVLAHEFGHFHGGDTRLGPWIHKARGAIVRTVQNLASLGSVLHLPFLWYGRLFLRVTHAVSRRQELAADALSAVVAGGDSAKAALQGIAGGAPMYELYLREDYSPAVECGLRPPLAEGFGRFLDAPRMQQLRRELGERALSAKADPYDTHPPLAERLAALERAATAAAARGDAAGDAAPAIDLLADRESLEARLLRFMVRGVNLAALNAAPWTSVADRVWPRRWRSVAFDHAAQVPPLRVAELVAQREWLSRLAADSWRGEVMDGAQRIGRLRYVLLALLGFRLHEAGFVVEALPGQPIVLRRGACAIELNRLLAPEADGGVSAAAWRALCSEQGIGELPVTGPAARPPSPR